MEAIILAGGFGTRLKSVVSDVPKPMAPIRDKPFLFYLLAYLKEQGVTKVTLSTGYKHEMIEDYIHRDYLGLSINYSVETEPLGTGGAIKQAFNTVSGDDVIVCNGDTLFFADIQQMYNQHVQSNVDVTIALRPMSDFSRYGTVITEYDRVIGFKEKQATRFGYINGGIYIVNRSALATRMRATKFSFETDFLETSLNDLKVGFIASDSYFIDIGVPEDYERAQREIPLNE